MCQYRNRRRKKEESASDYGYAVRRLAQRAYPSVSFSTLETQVIDQYADGLNNIEVKIHVILNKPTTLDRAISLATEYEAIDRINKINMKPRDGEAKVYAVKIVGKEKGTRSNVSGEDVEFEEWRDVNYPWKTWCLKYTRCFGCGGKGHRYDRCPASGKDRVREGAQSGERVGKTQGLN